MAETLSPEHRNELERESGIDPRIVDEMGAWTSTGKEELAGLGFRQPDIKLPALVFPTLTWAGGEAPAYHRIKPDAPRRDGKGKPRKYEQPHGQSCRVYCLPTARKLIEGIQGLPDRPPAALSFIFVTEGEKKAAALVSQGLAALGLPGVWNFKTVSTLRGDWDLIGLKGMHVCIVFDSDAATNEQVRRAEDRLAEMLRAMGARVFVCRLPEGPGGAKTGADDFFVRGGTVEELRELIEEHQPGKSDPTKLSTSDGLIELGKKLAELWHDTRGEAHATVPLVAGGFDNLPIRDARFRQWLGGHWYRSGKVAAAREALDRALENLAAHSIHFGVERPTAVRIGHTEGAVWLDLCDSRRRIVRADSVGWDFVRDDACPIRFLRPKNMAALPEPKRGGTLDALRQLLCVSDEGLKVIEAYMLGAFLPPPGGFPILVVTGEQGSGKSFGGRVLRSILDPSVLALRMAPKDDRDLAAALNSGYMLAFDNLSSVPTWLSNVLCSLATGGGIAQRELYTNADEHVVTGRRPVLLNGINDVTTAPDLAERCLFVDFIRPADAKRLTEKELEAVLKCEAGFFLGALLDRVSRALRDQSQMRPTSLPRLADFAVWVLAGTPEDERAAMTRVLAENQKAKSLSTIEDDPLASALRKLVAGVLFEGTAQELLAKLKEQEGIQSRNDRPEGWPTSATALGKRLIRLKTVLGAVGIEVRHSRTAKARTWTISKREEEQPSHESQASYAVKLEGEMDASGSDASYDTYGDVMPDMSLIREAEPNLAGPARDTSDAFDTSAAVPVGSSAYREEEL